MNAIPVLFLRWLALQGVVIFGLWVAADLGWLTLIWQSDESRLSLVIAGGLLLISVYAGWRSWCLGHVEVSAGNSALASESLADESLGAWLEREHKSPNELGWFVADLMVKLGLLGTVIGFILMLGSLSGIEDMDITSIQRMLLQMSGGMQVALYTTLAGLSAGMLTGVQFLMLDREADRLINRIQLVGGVSADGADAD